VTGVQTCALPISPEKLGKMWDGIVEQTGAFKGITGVKRDSVQSYQIALVTCAFQKNFFDVKVVYNRAGQVAGLFVVPVVPMVPYANPPYAKPDSVRDIAVAVGEQPWKLHGTLTVPKSGGPFPAIVLVHGSGPGDRDETIGPNKPFKDLALGLATRGIAVVRYEKRTREHAAKLMQTKDAITVKEETVDDALAAVRMLRDRDDIDKKKIFVLGHSLGGMLAPRIGAGDSSIAGLIILAGSTRPLEDVIVDQMEYLMADDSAASDSVRALLEQYRGQARLVKSPQLSLRTQSSSLPLGVPPAYWLDLRSYDPAAVAASLRMPILVLQGDRDYQVTAKDFDGWKRSLGKRNNVTFKRYDDLNHLFVVGKGKSKPAEYEKAGHVDARVIDDITAFVRMKN
jgi:fermentation-respiration switch protein FrsA (DUF1100 family)